MSPAAATTLSAGAAAVDITPALGCHLSGAVGCHRPAVTVLEPTFVRALLLQSHSTRFCLVVFDVTIITSDYTQRLREAVRQLCGEDTEVIVCATQTHSAPGIGKFMLDPAFPGVPADAEWLWGGEQPYGEYALAQAVEAVRQARETLEPVEFGAASGIEGRYAFNRRAIGRDGKVGMPGRCWPQPLGPTWIRCLEGPIDPELGLISLRTPDGRLKSLLAHYTCHPVHVFPRQYVSPDWPGALCDSLQQACGSDCVPLVLNGACGNINPWPPFEPHYADSHREMGEALAATAQSVLRTIEYRPQAELALAQETLPLPLRRLTDEEVAQAERVLAAHSGPAWTDDARTAVTSEWVTAASVYSLQLQYEREGYLPYEVQALRLGNVGLVALPGEPFVEGQLQIKLQSPAYPTYLAHCAGQYVGYIPTAEALERGGHEVQTRYWAKLRPGALDQIVGCAVGNLRRLFG